MMISQDGPHAQGWRQRQPGCSNTILHVHAGSTFDNAVTQLEGARDIYDKTAQAEGGRMHGADVNRTMGACSAVASIKVLTMPALMLKRSSRVMPGFLGTPAGMTTKSAPFKAVDKSSFS